MARVESIEQNNIEKLQSLVSPGVFEWTKTGWEMGKVSSKMLVLPKRIEEKYQQAKFWERVIVHELGHESLANNLGWIVLKFHIGKEGNALGYVRLSPPSKNPRQIDWDFVTICMGGLLANGKEGAGSDMHQATTVAAKLACLTGGSIANILTEARHRASSLLPNNNLLTQQSELAVYNYI